MNAPLRYKIVHILHSCAWEPRIYTGQVPEGKEPKALRALYAEFGDQNIEDKYKALAEWAGGLEVIQDEAEGWDDFDPAILAMNHTTYYIYVR